MSEPSKAIQHYVDPAMFEAQSTPTEPKVTLVGMTADPLGQIAVATSTYAGRNLALADITDEDRRHYFEQNMKTRLKAPFEFVQFHFYLDGVTRALTHQLVRQRTATYVQESMRFAVKEDFPVAKPPSLFEPGPNRVVMNAIWDEAVDDLGLAYRRLIDLGMPAEDARGLAPTNITTRIHWNTDLRALLDHAGARLCTQAQFEWRSVLTQVALAIRDYVPSIAVGVGPEVWDEQDSWQFKMLAGIFRPICFQTGKCEFMADTDRYCSIRERVEANHEVGRTGDKWDRDYNPDGRVPMYPLSRSTTDPDGKPVFIGAIRPAEWLADTHMARA